VTVYRKATRNGEVVRDEKLHSDVYSPQTHIVRIGTKPPEEEPTEGEELPPGMAPDEPGTPALPPTPGDAAPATVDDEPAPPASE